MSIKRTPQRTTFIMPDESLIYANLSESDLPIPRKLTPTGKISHAKTRVYTQRYRKEWEHIEEFKGWLTSVPFQQTRAYCLYCKKNLHAHRLSLLKHTCTMKHQRASSAYEEEERRKKNEELGKAEEFIEEVEAMDQLITEENEEDNDYVVEKLDTDEEDMMTNQEIKNDTEELIGDGEEVEKEIDNDLCAQLQSDDEDFKPVIKKIKLEKCRDTLAEAMAHVHSEYLEEEVADQEAVQMEMVVEEAPNSDESDKSDLIEAVSLPMDSVYQANVSSISDENAINFVPSAPNLKTNNQTVMLTCGSKTFTLTGGTFQPGTQYILTKLKGKSATLITTDQNESVMTNESDKNKLLAIESPNINQTISIDSNQQSTFINTNQQASIKDLSSKKIVMGKLPTRSNASKKLRISTYVMDNTKGLPINGLQVSLYKLMDGKWTFLNESTTNMNGFCIDLVEKMNCTTGRYKLHFDVAKYFTLRRVETLFPFVEIVFDVKNPNSHYHIPLLLSPFSYTVHRGA